MPVLFPLQCHGQSINLWPTKGCVPRKQGRRCAAPQSDTVPSPWSLFWILGPPSLWVAVRPVQSKQGLKPLTLLWRCPWLLHQERQWQGTRAASSERLASSGQEQLLGLAKTKARKSPEMILEAFLIRPPPHIAHAVTAMLSNPIAMLSLRPCLRSCPGPQSVGC